MAASSNHITFSLPPTPLHPQSYYLLPLLHLNLPLLHSYKDTVITIWACLYNAGQPLPLRILNYICRVLFTIPSNIHTFKGLECGHPRGYVSVHHTFLAWLCPHPLLPSLSPCLQLNPSSLPATCDSEQWSLKASS